MTAQVTVDEDAVVVAENLLTLMRAFGRARAELLAAAAHDVEWSAQMVLRCLAHAGPQRSGAIAERLHADPSTISRQVAALVKEGLVERHADPEDGRACLLALTDKAGAALERHDAIRNEYVARMLADWSERDLRRFAALLARFTHDFETANTDWLAERAGTAASREDKHR
ncbi:MAG: MarR family winged helix-turn-helix transcriptional regulator [Sciscionella sp.]